MQKLVALFCTLASATWTIENASDAAAARKTTYPLGAERSRGTTDQVEVTFEVAGELKMIEDGKVQRGKMSVVASFLYDEKSLEVPGEADRPLRSIRYYDNAEGVVRSGERAYRPTLREERRLIGVETDAAKVTVFSPQGPLTSDEWELIDMQANSLLLDRLLPGKPTPLGGKWGLSDDLIMALLGLEAVTNNQVESTLKAVDNGRAQIEILGQIAGSVRGATTTIELKGRYYFDLGSKRITWFGLLVREDRSIGHIDTGFDAVARLQMKITPGRRSEHLSGAALAGVTLEPTAELTQLSYESAEGKWRLSHSRCWFVITDDKDQAILRLIDQGDRLGQGSVASLPNAADPTQLTLEAFQKDVAHALGDHFKSFVRAGQWHSDDDYRVFRIVAEGEVSKIPMQWIYYLVADKHGRRVVFAFVVEQDQRERFDEADRKLVGTFRFTEPKMAAKPDSGRQQPEGKR